MTNKLVRPMSKTALAVRSLAGSPLVESVSVESSGPGTTAEISEENGSWRPWVTLVPSVMTTVNR